MLKACPFVKWAGGKRQLLASIRRRLPSQMNTYYEPFVGGGTVFFALANRGAFKRAVLNDLNLELADTYTALATGKVQSIIDLLKSYPYNQDFFTELRTLVPTELSLEERAARFLYLNKTAFNGLFRVNQSGGFNVPFGRYTNPTICDSDNLQEAAKALQGVTIECQDFSLSVSSAQAGDVIYFDPPYLPKSSTANFVSYTKEGFGVKEHQRLAQLYKDLAGRGVSVLLSNADLPTVRKLYQEFQIDSIQAKRSINSDGDKRGLVGEVLIGANLGITCPK
jgi:DNA adenine methylase